MNAPPQANGHEVLSKPRQRAEAAKVLGVALQTRYRRFLETADDQDENARATAELAQVMYENVEFVIWALKSIGGMYPPPPLALKPITRTLTPPPKPESVLELPCTCEPLEHGIIGRDKHMASCPKFKP